jgi:twinkle protein
VILRRADQFRFEALTTRADLLAKVKKFIIGGDMDGPGRALVEEMCRRLGRARCWLVRWPDGCKDASDTLRQFGPDAVLDARAAAMPYPIEGIYRVDIGMLAKLRQLPKLEVMTTGCESVDKITKLPTEGRLIGITGYCRAADANS